MVARDDDEIKSGTYPRREGTLGGGRWIIRAMERDGGMDKLTGRWIRRWRGYFSASFSVSFRVKGGS